MCSDATSRRTSATGRALFVLVVARPSFWKDYPQRFAGRDHLRIELRPIPRRAAMEIARAVIGCDAEDPKLDQVARQAAGSPLFAEELIRYLVSKGADVTAVSRRGQTTADMANGPVQRIPPFLETVALLEKLGSKNNHKCRSC